MTAVDRTTGDAAPAESGLPVDLEELKQAIERVIEPMRCTQPGRPAPGIEHCAACCMQTGYVATCIEEHDLCVALDDALHALARLRQLVVTS